MPLLSVATSLVFSILVRFWLGQQMIMCSAKVPVDNGLPRYLPRALFSSDLIRSGWGFGETLLLLHLLWLPQDLLQPLRLGFVCKDSNRTNNFDISFSFCFCFDQARKVRARRRSLKTEFCPRIRFSFVSVIGS